MMAKRAMPTQAVSDSTGGPCWPTTQARETSRKTIKATIGAATLAIVTACFTLTPPLGWLPHLTAHAEQVFDPSTGYRINRYRAAVPDDVPGGRRIWIDELDDLRARSNALLIDVMPVTGFGYDKTTGRWRLSKRHDHIPGSTWLPEVGRGRISPVLQAYFETNLAKLTGSDTSHAIIVYCQSDCWMAWNAVQRAAGYGYTNLYWYAEGIDGWRDDDRALVQAEPVPVNVAPSAEPARNR